MSTERYVMDTHALLNLANCAVDESVADERMVSLATPAELNALPLNMDMDLSAVVRGTFENWYLVAFRLRTMETTLLMLFGNLNNRTRVLSSVVIGVDLKRGFVRTKNSIYRLGRQGDGEPDYDMITLRMF